MTTQGASAKDVPLSDAHRAKLERRLVRKLDARLLPILTVLYLLSFLDRSNIGNAKLDGLTTDLKMTQADYLNALTLYFLGYNMVLKRLTPRLWLPTIMVVWGIVSTLMGLVHNYAGLLAVRFFLGATEAGLFPGVVYYLSCWYKRKEQHFRISIFSALLASQLGAFGGALAYAIGKMDGIGRKSGWSWIFIIEGLLTIVIALLSYVWVHNYPDTVSFLSPEEKTLLHERLRADNDALSGETFRWPYVKKAFEDVAVWLYCLCFVGCSLPLYTLSLFLPTIIADLGYAAAEAQLLTVPPYFVATVLTFATAWGSHLLNRRAPFIIIGAILPSLAISSSSPPRRRASSTSPHSCVRAASIQLRDYAVMAREQRSGQLKRAVACALQISVGNGLGAIVGTQLYRYAPRFYLGHGFAIGYLVLVSAAAALNWYVLARRNREKERLLQSGEISEKDDEESRLLLGDEHPLWKFQV
ncbi:major facilitator superfamily domain-containing protein [Fomitopsis serialis]|uniref:major facilitator superfamily domain-containing protein n=1 Tax=Fomitopsis serialis TaxID=139415 RepID=UPI0020081045|nr:major facilitator superfamily domain-containing protein [Neoantrodia serialis]KAH9935277.1 major facilitator superfamily domain-containing protein [Neoantrodia serialis]